MNELYTTMKERYGNLSNFFSSIEEDLLIKNPVWDENARSRYIEAIDIAFEIFPKIVFSNPEEPLENHIISARLKILDLTGEKLIKYKRLVELSDYIDGDPGKGFMQLGFAFSLCHEA